MKNRVLLSVRQQVVVLQLLKKLAVRLIRTSRPHLFNQFHLAMMMVVDHHTLRHTLLVDPMEKI
jgi:hypothetical protein